MRRMPISLFLRLLCIPRHLCHRTAPRRLSEAERSGGWRKLVKEGAAEREKGLCILKAWTRRADDAFGFLSDKDAPHHRLSDHRRRSEAHLRNSVVAPSHLSLLTRPEDFSELSKQITFIRGHLYLCVKFVEVLFSTSSTQSQNKTPVSRNVMPVLGVKLKWGSPCFWNFSR